MKILLVHNRYKFTGGEDAVFESEKLLLESRGHTVKLHSFSNASSNTFLERIKLAYNFIYNVESAKIIVRLIEEFKPDIIHIHNLFYVASPSILYAAHKCKIPTIVTLHNYRLICSGALLMRDNKPCELCVGKTFPIAGIRYACHRNSRLETALLTFVTGLHKILSSWSSKATYYIALSEFARNKFLNSSLRISPQKIVVKSNSVEDRGFASPMEREGFYLFIGRLSVEKGIMVLIDAFSNKQETLEIIGEGPLTKYVEAKASTSSNIKILGYRDNTFVVERLKKCRALVVPSICYESLPTAVLEAFATGTPVIISDIDNLNTIVENHYNGVHFKVNNAIDLYSVVSAFNKNEILFPILCSNARKTFLEKYSHDVNYENLMIVYKSAMKKNLNRL